MLISNSWTALCAVLRSSSNFGTLHCHIRLCCCEVILLFADVTKHCFSMFWCSARMRGSLWASFMRPKPGRCFVRLVLFPSRLIPIDWTWLAISRIELCNELFECLNEFPCLAAIQNAQHILGNNYPHTYLSFSTSLHPSFISGSLPPCCRCSRRSSMGRNMCGSW